jgi:predicted molibdopterin-dependent oxidoreductase YjgC
MLKRLDPGPAQGLITFTFAGRPVRARAGDSVAAALLAAGVTRFRDSAVSHSPRAPYCMMGVCFECLLEIDGRANRQACLVPVAEGMRVEPGRSE